MRTVNQAVHERQTARITRTALHLFAVNGYAPTSLQGIAKACGIQKASLYHYFTGKEALLHSIIEGHINRMQARIHPGTPPLDMESALREAGKSLLRDMDEPENRDFMALLVQDSGTNSYIRRVFFSLAKKSMGEARRRGKNLALPLNRAINSRTHLRCMHQFLGSLLRYGIEAKIWKSEPARLFPEKEYLESLVGIFSRGMKGMAAGLAMLLALAAPVAAAEPVELSLDNFLSQVSEKSPALEAARQSRKGLQLKPLEIAMIYSPLFNAGYSFTDSQAEPTSLTSPDRTKFTNWQLGLTKKWFTGTTTILSYGMNNTRLYFPAFPPAMAVFSSFLPPSDSFDAKPTLTVSQSLLRDFMGGITDTGIAKVQHAAKAGERMTAYGEQAAMLQAEMAYWSLALARATVEFKKKSLERTTKLKDWTERRVKLNLADQADLLQTDAALRLRTLDLQMSEEDAESAARKFNLARGQEGTEVAETLPEMGPRIASLEKMPEQTGERLDVQAARESLISAEAAADETFYRSLPDLSVFGSITENGHDTSASGAHSKAMQGDWPAWTVGATLTAPLDLFTLAKVRQGYNSDFAGAKASFKKTDMEATQDWEALKNKWAHVKARLELARDVVKLQEERMIGEQKRLENGRILTFQYLSAQDDFDSAQLTYLRLGLEKISVEAQARMYNAAYGPR